eukprot:TRINITY_DN13738_c0_g1_i2.p1 TRINITY_DN13738_c0_g1~~TRINITY_DN13738_c0_g1_i2.p1  ORF type:complete len:104 (+),score=29.77 TRINITY_DN13738_c0_g1_i2:70-381(+)
MCIRDRSSAKDSKEVKQMYLQALLVINLLLREHYDLENQSLKATDDAFLEYEIVDDDGKRIGYKNELENEVREVMQFTSFSPRELTYVTRIKAELCKECTQAK